jgi:hypothetical protein
MTYSFLRITGKNTLAREMKPAREQSRDLVRVKVLRTGVCGGDVRSLFRGEPKPFCHEYVGVVESGPIAFSSLIGRTVVGKNSVACSECNCCKRGNEKECSNRWLLDEPAAANYIDVPAFSVFPTSLPPEIAILIEPLAAVISNFVDICPHLSTERRVAILGQGPMAKMARYYLATQGIIDSPSPVYTWLYSERLLQNAVAAAQKRGMIALAYSPSAIHISGDVLYHIRNKLLSLAIVVASPNNCFAEAEEVLRDHSSRFQKIIGQKANMNDPDAVIFAINSNTTRRCKTVLLVQNNIEHGLPPEGDYC